MAFFIRPCNLRNDRSPPTMCHLLTSLLLSGFGMENSRSVLSRSGYSAHLKSRSKAAHGSWRSKCNISLLVTWVFFQHIMVIIFFFVALISHVARRLNLFLIDCLHSTTLAIHIFLWSCHFELFNFAKYFGEVLAQSNVPYHPAVSCTATISASPVVHKSKKQREASLLSPTRNEPRLIGFCFVSYRLSPQSHCVGSCVITEDQGRALHKCL